MNSWNNKPLLTILFLVLLTWNPALADELPEGLNDFVHKFQAAAKQQDGEALKALAHSTVQNCTADAKQQQFYDQFIAQTIRSFSIDSPIMKTKYQPFSQEDLDKITPRLKKKKLSWPVSPDGRVIVMYAVFHKISKLGIYVKLDKDGWKWIPYCRKEDREENDPVAAGSSTCLPLRNARFKT